MRINIPQSQIQFFREHSYLQLEQLLPPKQVETLRNIFLPGYLEKPFETTYINNRDLFRQHPSVKKIETSPSIFESISTLTHKRRLRLAWDQMLFSLPSHESIHDLAPVFQGIYNLKQISSVNHLLCGVLINIDAIDPPSQYPSQPGDALFFTPKFPLDIHELITQPHQTFLLVVYADEKALYIDQPLDPAGHTLKKQGYGFGDRLQHTTHPLMLLPSWS